MIWKINKCKKYKQIYNIYSSNIKIVIRKYLYKSIIVHIYEGWNFNSGNYLFTTDTK